MVDDDQQNWDEKLDTILMGYRASRQSSTKHSPYYMLFQQQMRLPVDSELLTSDIDSELLTSDEQDYDKEDGEDISEIIEQLLESRQKAFDKAESNIEHAQKKQKELYDRKHQPDELPEGSMVLLENTAQKQRKGGKLCPAWLGPYTISKHLGKGVYELTNQTGVIIRKKANISRLKVYTQRDGKEPEDKENQGGAEDGKGEDQGKEKGDSTEEKGDKGDSGEKKENEKKRKRVVDSDRAKKKHHMAAMSEKSLKQILEGKPLHDDHISFAQKLLQKQFPMLDGLQSPLLSQNSGFCPVKDESIQIHHTGKFHWVTSSSIGGNVQVYDSMFEGGELSSSLQIQLAQIYMTLIKEEDGNEEEGNGYKYLELKVPALQVQSGGKDCGVFAIAFAYHAAKGDDLRKMRFHQERLRPHLVQCFKKKHLESFPHTSLEKPQIFVACMQGRVGWGGEVGRCHELSFLHDVICFSP